MPGQADGDDVRQLHGRPLARRDSSRHPPRLARARHGHQEESRRHLRQHLRARRRRPRSQSVHPLAPARAREVRGTLPPGPPRVRHESEGWSAQGTRRRGERAKGGVRVRLRGARRERRRRGGCRIRRLRRLTRRMGHRHGAHAHASVHLGQRRQARTLGVAQGSPLGRIRAPRGAGRRARVQGPRRVRAGGRRGEGLHRGSAGDHPGVRRARLAAAHQLFARARGGATASSGKTARGRRRCSTASRRRTSRGSPRTSPCITFSTRFSARRKRRWWTSWCRWCPRG